MTFFLNNCTNWHKDVQRWQRKDFAQSKRGLIQELFEPRYEKTGFLHICDNKDADQRICFRYIDSAIPLLSKSEIYSP